MKPPPRFPGGRCTSARGAESQGFFLGISPRISENSLGLPWDFPGDLLRNRWGFPGPLPGIHRKIPGKSLGYTRASPWAFPRNLCIVLGQTMPNLGKLFGGPMGNSAKFLGEAWPILGGLLRRPPWQILQSARQILARTLGLGNILGQMTWRILERVMQTSWGSHGQLLGTPLEMF